MLAGGGWQEGDSFLEKIALVLNLPVKVGFQEVEKWGKKGAKAHGSAIQGWSVFIVTTAQEGWR